MVELTEAAKAVLADEGYDPASGARPLRRAIQRLVEDPLSEAILKGHFKAGDTVMVDGKDGHLSFNAKKHKEEKVAAHVGQPEG
jgi:ATP-dependent Clp protease ATP-binding subunit ClpC